MTMLVEELTRITRQCPARTASFSRTERWSPFQIVHQFHLSRRSRCSFVFFFLNRNLTVEIEKPTASDHELSIRFTKFINASTVFSIRRRGISGMVQRVLLPWLALQLWTRRITGK